MLAGLPMALLASPAGAMQLHGYAKATASAQLSDEPWVDATSRLQADLSGKTRGASFRATVDLDMDAGALDMSQLSRRELELELIPVECRVGAHGSWFDLFLGKQYVFWGQTDWINPTDLFTPWDYVHMSNELEDYRIAPWAARFQAFFGQASLDLVWVPYPVPDVMDFSSMESDTVHVGDPVFTREHPFDLGLRLNGRFAGFDASLVAFSGMDKRPGFSMEMDLEATPPILELVPTYGSMQAVGGDISRGLGPLLLKAESAWYRTEDLQGDDPQVRNPELYSVAGLTWVPGNHLNMSLQGTWSHLLLFDPQADLAALEAMGDPEPSADALDTWGLVERLSWSWRDTVSLSAVALQYLPDQGFFGLGYLSWRAADGLTVLGGALLFGGPRGSTFGDISELSRVFGEIKYSF